MREVAHLLTLLLLKDVPSVGTFDWTRDFNWKPGVRKHGEKPTDPVEYGWK